MSVGDENVFMLTLDAEALRSHFADAPDNTEEGSDDQRVSALSDAALDAAGAVVINRLSDEFWAAVDGLFRQALDLAERDST